MGVMDSFRGEVVDIIHRNTGVKKEGIRTEYPKEPSFGDLSFPCFTVSKNLGKDPVEMATELSLKMQLPEKGLIGKIEAKGPYLNFFINWKRGGNILLKEILKDKGRFGSGKRRGKSVLVEHTSANPDGPLHLGHFRNSAMGDSIARILAFSGYDVKTDFLFNDTGRQIAIAVMEYLKAAKKTAKTKKPDWWVLDLYIRGNREIEKNPKLEEEIKKLMVDFESGDPKLRKAYSTVTGECIKGHKETLAGLGIGIDHYTAESSFAGKNIEDLKKRIASLKEGRLEGKRVWMDLSRFGIDREFTLTRSDGTSLYPLRDLAYHAWKFSQADMNVNVIGTDQKFYFRQLTSTLSLLFPKEEKNYRVVFYEFLLLPEGSMSTRMGKFISMDELIEKFYKEAMKTVEKKMPKYSKAAKESVARAVAKGALKYAMLKVSPEKTYAFKVEDTLSFEGNTAPYLQYSHARACSILRKAKKQPTALDSNLLSEHHEKEIMKLLSEFPEAVERAGRDLRPHYIANYCYGLAMKFNEYYQSVPVLRAGVDLMRSRLALVKAVSITLGNGLSLLGIEAPERM